MEAVQRYDIAIIGTGPAGLSAAMTAKARNKEILLLGSPHLSDKVAKAHVIRNYPGLPDISGGDMQRAFLEHLDKMEIAITDDRVSMVCAMGGYFALAGRENHYEASGVILATGVSAAKPYPGELEHLGRGVSYCATCDAALYRGKTAIVVAFSGGEEPEAAFLAETAEKVYYLPMYAEKPALDCANVEILSYDQRPADIRIKREGDHMCLETESGSLAADGIFLLREQVAPSRLVPGLAVTQERIETDRNMCTNIDGLFACGDVTGAPYQYVKAAGEGNVAALSAVSYLSHI